MPFAVLLAGAPEGYPLKQQAAVADLGRFADHHPHAVVDEYGPGRCGPPDDLHYGKATGPAGTPAAAPGEAPAARGDG